MPPQVGSAREGTRPVAPQTPDGVEQTKSSELEKKPAEQQKNTSDGSATQIHRASPEEKTGRLKELSVRGDLTKATLNNKLKALNTEGTGKLKTLQQSKEELKSLRDKEAFEERLKPLKEELKSRPDVPDTGASRPYVHDKGARRNNALDTEEQLIEWAKKFRPRG